MMTETQYKYIYWRMINCQWRKIKYLPDNHYIPSSEFEKVLPVGQKP